MFSCTKFKTTPKFIFDKSGPLEGYVYENLLDNDFYIKLKNHVVSVVDKSNKNTFLTHGTVVHHNDISRKLISHSQNAREQNVVYDLSFTKEWYYQTVDTIKSWSNNKLKRDLSPLFFKYYSILEKVEPIKQDFDDYIFYRLHLNYLPYGESLSLHTDASPMNAKESAINQHECRIRSLTFYLYDHQENMGGEFWSIDGFVYKPKQNSALLILNGNDCSHGVTANMLSHPRYAFTLRMWHKDDLFLPGHPDKFIYNVLQDL